VIVVFNQQFQTLGCELPTAGCNPVGKGRKSLWKSLRWPVHWFFTGYWLEQFPCPYGFS